MATYLVDTTLPYLRRRHTILLLRALGFFGCAAAAWGLGRADWMKDLGTLAALLGATTAFGMRSLRRAMRQTGAAQITITSDSVRRSDVNGESVLQRHEIASFAEPPRGRGLIVRARPPKKSLVIPADVEHYEMCRAELEAIRIPRSPFAARGRWALSAGGVLVLSVLMLLLARNHNVRVTSGLLLGIAMVATAIFSPNRKTSKADASVRASD